jgi:hypothetical protein
MRIWFASDMTPRIKSARPTETTDADLHPTGIRRERDLDSTPGGTMQATNQSTELEDPIRSIGPDSTATFDSTASNPTEHASSEVLDSATAVEDEDDVVDEEDDEEYGDEDDEDEDDDIAVDVDPDEEPLKV